MKEPAAFIARHTSTSGRVTQLLIRRSEALKVPKAFEQIPLYEHSTEADDLLRQVLKEADEFAVEMGLEPGQLQDKTGLLARIRTYVEGLDDA